MRFSSFTFAASARTAAAVLLAIGLLSAASGCRRSPGFDTARFTSTDELYQASYGAQFVSGNAHAVLCEDRVLLHGDHLRIGELLQAFLAVFRAEARLLVPAKRREG